MDKLTEENLSKLNDFYIKCKSNINNLLRDKPNIDLNKLFYLFCKVGYYIYAKLLIQYYNLNINHGDALRLACENEHLEIIKWLLTFDNNRIKNINFAFQIICYKGNLIIIQWFHSIYNNVINYKLPFKILCKNGHFEIIKWLLSVENINISEVNGEALYLAYENGHLNIVKYLLSNDNMSIFSSFDNQEITKLLINFDTKRKFENNNNDLVKKIKIN